MKKILGLTIAAIIVIAMTGIGSWAYFNDSEESTGNILAAGTLDLKTNTTDGTSANLTLVNMAPADSVGPVTIALNNAGSIVGDNLILEVTYVEDDGTEPTDAGLAQDVTEDEFAAQIVVDTLTYGADNLLTAVTDANTNLVKDLEDVNTYYAASNTHELAGLLASASKNFIITVHMNSAADNDYQADGIDVTFKFTLNQE